MDWAPLHGSLSIFRLLYMKVEPAALGSGAPTFTEVPLGLFTGQLPAANGQRAKFIWNSSCAVAP